MSKNLPSSILFQNKEKNVTLLDIPTSIAAANGFNSVLLSVEPLEVPYTIHNEPKNQKARDKHAAHAETGKHVEYKDIILRALSTIRSSLSPDKPNQNIHEMTSKSTHEMDMDGSAHMAYDQLGAWCLPRRCATHMPQSKDADMDIDDPSKDLEARLHEWSSESKEDKPFDFQKMMNTLSESADATSLETVPPWLMSYCSARDNSSTPEDGLLVIPKEHEETPWTSSFHNSCTHAVDLTVSASRPQQGNREQYSFKVPPLATLFLGDITCPKDFRASFRELTEEFVLPRHFDFILLDPPWPNSSVKRKGNYKQIGGLGYMKKILLGLDLDSYFEHNALVTIWITNSKATRDLVLGEGGLFEQWNVGLVEEWLWIKTTSRGQPMFSLDSLWKKPYEVLLVGRAAPNSWTTMASSPLVPTRVIAAVPDIHSRKPCLKELIEDFMPDTDDYSALEVFGRHLVSGWTSWGNEVLKYNWEKCWGTKMDQG